MAKPRHSAARTAADRRTAAMMWLAQHPNPTSVTAETIAACTHLSPVDADDVLRKWRAAR